MAKDASTSDVDPVLARAEKLLSEGQKLLAELQGAVRLTAMAADGTCPIFYQDQVVHVALPWVSVDRLQMNYADRRMPADPILLDQIIDLLPTLEGKAFIDVGSYTAGFAMLIRQFLRPAKTHLIEPQNTMKDAIALTIAANGATKDTKHHAAIIDEMGAEIAIGQYRPDRLSDVKYLRRTGGKLSAISLDSLSIKKVGYINFEFNNTKVYALRSALGTIERDRPFISLDLTAGDLAEIRDILAPFEYGEIPAGRHGTIFVPKG